MKLSAQNANNLACLSLCSQWACANWFRFLFSENICDWFLTVKHADWLSTSWNHYKLCVHATVSKERMSHIEFTIFTHLCSDGYTLLWTGRWPCTKFMQRKWRCDYLRVFRVVVPFKSKYSGEGGVPPSYLPGYTEEIVRMWFKADQGSTSPCWLNPINMKLSKSPQI